MLSLLSAPKMGWEMIGASLLGIAVVCYLARVAWIALAQARRMEVAAIQVATARGVAR